MPLLFHQVHISVVCILMYFCSLPHSITIIIEFLYFCITGNTFWKHYSTEAALTFVVNNILLALDKGNSVFLVL